MSDVYYVVGGVAYGIFILQFIISWVAGELDVDVDFDGDADFRHCIWPNEAYCSFYGN